MVVTLALSKHLVKVIPVFIITNIIITLKTDQVLIGLTLFPEFNNKKRVLNKGRKHFKEEKVESNLLIDKTFGLSEKIKEILGLRSILSKLSRKVRMSCVRTGKESSPCSRELKWGKVGGK